MDINEMAQEAHKTSISKGFYSDVLYNFAEKLMLIVSELSEALEAHRENHRANVDTFVKEVQVLGIGDEQWAKSFTEHIKNSVEDELADAMIRIGDLAQKEGIDLDWHVQAKMAYNKTRPYKHGKEY